MQKEYGILDVGCGVGTMLLYLYCLGYHDLHGTDRDPAMIRTAKKLFNHYGVKALVEEGELLDQAKKQYGLITCLNVLYSQPDNCKKLISESCQYLVQNGQLVFTLYLWNRQPIEERYYPKEDDIIKLAKHHGFSFRMLFYKVTLNAKHALFVFNKS